MYNCFLLKVIFFIWKSDGRNCTLKGISFNHLILSKHTITIFSSCKSSDFGSSSFWVFFSKAKPIVLLQACVTRWEIGSVHTYSLLIAPWLLCVLFIPLPVSAYNKSCRSIYWTLSGKIQMTMPKTSYSTNSHYIQIIKLSEMICDINQYRNVVWFHVPSLTDHFC